MKAFNFVGVVKKDANTPLVESKCLLLNFCARGANSRSFLDSGTYSERRNFNPDRCNLSRK